MRVLLLHAFPLDHRMWDAQAAALVAAGHEVIAPDLPGFGDTPLVAGPPSLPAVAEAIAAEHLGEPAVVAGLSLGGYVLMQLLRTHADRIRGAMLLDTKASADADAAIANRRRIADAADADPASLGRLLATAMLPTLLAPGSAARTTVEGWLMQAPPATVAWYQRAMAARPDSHAVLAAYRGPALVLWGALDAVSPEADQQAMVGALGDARTAVIPDAGHLSAVEQPDAVSMAMIAALAAWQGPGALA